MVPAAKKKYWYQRAQQNLIEAAHLQAYLDWNKSHALVVSPDLGKLMTDLRNSLHKFAVLRESDEDYARKMSGDKLQQAQTDKALRILSGEHSATKGTRTVDEPFVMESPPPPFSLRQQLGENMDFLTPASYTGTTGDYGRTVENEENDEAETS